MENKKIKKLTKVNRNSTVRFKKTCLRPQRAQTAVITKPPRAYGEAEVYQLESDLLFAIQDTKPVFDLSMLNHSKYITSAEVRKDLNENIVTFLLEPYQNSERTTCSTLADDGKLDEEWTESLKSFGENYEGFLMEFLDAKKETSMQKKMFLYKMREQTAAKRLYLLSTYPSFEMRYRMRKDEIQCTELCFNETFLREAGYTMENFTSTVLSEGLPQFFPLNSPAMMETMQGLMEHYMINETELPEQEVDLLMKTGYRKKTVLQAVILVELSETDLILSLIFYMKMKSLPYGSYQKSAFSQEFLEILKNQDKQKEHLFRAYYGEKCHGLHSNTERVCKIKEINPCQS